MIRPYKKKYRMAHFIGEVSVVIGLAKFGIGLVGLALSALMAAGVVQGQTLEHQSAVWAIPVFLLVGYGSFLTITGGLLLIALGQIIQAIVGNTNNTGAMLALMRAGGGKSL